MKAIVYHEYGAAEVLKLEEVEQPVPKDDEVLIRVRACGLNPLDWRLMGGKPAVLRLFTGLSKPRNGRPGLDMSGEVEAVGKNVTQFKVGDKVFGAARGALAEYACTRSKGVVTKPDEITFEQAASINVAGLTALQGLRNHGKVQAGQQVLINGASGGVGTFAVQIAKSFGAEVTGVCSTHNVELVHSIGADNVVDYTKEDFTNLPQRNDMILDTVGNKAPSECARVLKDSGRLIIVGGKHDPSLIDLLAAPAKAIAMSLFGKKKAKFFIAKASQDDLTLLANMIVTGKLTPVIGRCYSLDETAEAMRHLEAGHARGKVILTVNGPQ